MNPGLTLFLVMMLIFGATSSISYIEFGTEWGHQWMLDNYNLIVDFICDIYNTVLNKLKEIV